MKRSGGGLAIAIVLGVLAPSIAADPPDLVVALERALAPFEASAETRAFIARAQADLRRLDLAAFFAALPDSFDASGARAVVFEGRLHGAVRRVEQKPVPAALREPSVFDPEATAPPLVPLGPDPGDGWLVGVVRPLGAASDHFRVRAAAALRTGRTDLAATGPTVASFLRRLERRARDAGVSRSDATPLRTMLAEEFPSAARRLFRFVDLDGVVSWSESRRRMTLSPMVRIRPEALAADHPDAARWVARILAILRSEGRAEAESGAAIAKWSFRGPEGIAIETAARDGRLLPLSGDDAAVDLTAPMRLVVTSSSSIEALGLRTSIERLRATLELDPPAGRSRATLAGMPAATAVEGRLFGVLSPTALDLLVPGTIEGIFADLLRSMLEGRDGRGIELLVRSTTDAPQRHLVQSDVAVEVSSHRLVRVALAIGARWLYPSDVEIDDLSRLASELVAALASDYATTPDEDVDP